MKFAWFAALPILFSPPLLCGQLAANPQQAASQPADPARWKDLVAQRAALDQEIASKLRALRERAKNATPQEQLALRTEFPQMQQTYNQKHRALVNQMRPLAQQIHNQDPGNVAAAEFVMQDAYQENQYKKSSQIADQLIAAGHLTPLALNIGGVSHFAENRFQRALELLQHAQRDNLLDQSGGQYLSAAAEYQPLWEKEQALRDAEAAAPAERANPQLLLKTSRGDILVELFENEAPLAVANFINLAEKNFYDGTKFHRVLPNFMAQGGDPNSKDDDPRNDGSGGPDYTIACECDRPDARMHFAGSLSMAHAGKDTGGSQFFLTHLPTQHLNGRHTVFGRVTEGLDTARALKKGDTIESATVVRKRDHPYQPQTTPKGS